MVSLMINTLDIKAKVMKIHKSNNCVEKIRSYLGNMVDNPRVSGECKIHLTMEINFMLSENYNKGQPIFSESVNIEIMIGSYKNKVTNQILVQFFVDIKWVWKHQWKEVILFLKAPLKCITNVIE